MTSGTELTEQERPAARSLEAQKRNGRLGSRKSKAGCLTCKIRRVKCDERHPACERCTSTGRRCDGYAFPSSSRMNSSLVRGQLSSTLGIEASNRRAFDYFLMWTAPRLAGSMDKEFWCGHVLQLAHSEPLVVNALLAISILYEHPQCFSSFYVVQRKALSPVKVTVPVSNQGTLVSESALSVNSLQEDRMRYESAGDDDHSSFTLHLKKPDQNYTDALRHYNRAIQSFKERMAAGQASLSLALLSCILFICIELLRDHVLGALNLFSKGAEILKQLPAGSQNAESQLLKTLKLAFARLGVLVEVLGHPVNIPHESIYSSNPGEFESIEDARTALYALMLNSHAFIRDATRYKAGIDMENLQSKIDSDLSSMPFDLLAETSQAVLPPTLGIRPARSGSRQSAGHPPQSINENASASVSDSAPPTTHAYTPSAWTPETPPSGYLRGPDMPSIETQGPNVPPELLDRQAELQQRLEHWHAAFQRVRARDEEAASSLLMQYHVSVIWQTSRLAPHQAVFDDYTRHFEEILRQAEAFIAAKAAERPMFTFEIGAVPPLFFAATKCRAPALRRRALELLMRAPQKECMFGARACAELGARLVAVEEEGMDLAAAGAVDGGSVLPPERNRVQGFEVVRDAATGRFDVRVARRWVDAEGRRRETVTDYPI